MSGAIGRPEKAEARRTSFGGRRHGRRLRLRAASMLPRSSGMESPFSSASPTTSSKRGRARHSFQRKYRAPRLISMGGFVAKELMPRRGVVAGCGFATALIKAYCIEPFDDFVDGNNAGNAAGAHGARAGERRRRQRQRQQLGQHGDDGARDSDTDFDAYIDDFGLTVQADTEEAVVEDLVEAQARLKDILNRDLHTEISLSKAGIVATSDTLADRLRKRIGIDAGPRVPSLANLGVDYSAGRKRDRRGTGRGRKKRIAGAFARRCRIAALAKALTRRQLSGIYTAGIAPAADYGAAVNGLADEEVRKLRQVAAAAYSPRGRGRSLTMTLLLNGMPTWTSEMAPAVQYARSVWRASAGMARGQDFDLVDFSSMWRELEDCNYFQNLFKKAEAGEDDAADATLRKWAVCRGPLGAKVLSLHRIGWRASGPFTWVDDNGCSLSLTQNSPALIKILLKKATQRAAQRRMAKTWADEGDAVFRNKRLCTDVVCAELKSTRHLTPLERGALASTVADAVWTRSRAHRAGYDVPSTCPLCGAFEDTVHHRVWWCPHTSAARQTVPEWLVNEARRAPHSERFWTSGIFPNPSPNYPQPCTSLDAVCVDGSGTAIEGVENWGLQGDIYIDGSCTRCDMEEMQRAGFAIVAVDDQGNVVKTVRAVVPSPLPQTPQAAEFAAYALAHRLVNGPCRIFSDCKHVVDNALGGTNRMLDPSRAYAGVLRDTLKNLEGQKHVKGLIKVKAHQTISAMAEGVDKERAEGNAKADENAKAAVRMHPAPTSEQQQALQHWLDRASLVARVTGRAMAVFPPMGQRLKKVRHGAIRNKPCRRTAVTGQAADEPEGPDHHDWSHRGGKWRCGRCARIHIGEDFTVQLRRQRCPGPRPQMNVEAMEKKGHRMAIAEANVPFAICMRCGAWAARRLFRQTATRV